MTFLFSFCIFLSGCAGLIYEVVWHRYLSILLGAQARATVIVLAIFLGGISLGYALFGKWTRYKNWNLLRVYAFVEVGLGLWAALFPFFFRAMTPVTSYLYAWWGVGSLAIDILVAVILIGPPTFLMGGTLPLLTQGLSENFEKASRTHALIYGVNTLGACLGSALTGYVLIPWIGLKPTVWVGAILNLVVALIALLVFSRRWSPRQITEKPATRWDFNISAEQASLFGIAFLSGFCLITLQTILIRLMGLSTGSSNYNFTLIVTIFIFGLGIGSLMVREISGYNYQHLLRNQIAVLITMTVLYFSGDYWSYIVHLVRTSFRDNAEVFFPYQMALGAAFSALLLVPIGFAGLTLPLCFHLLKDKPERLGYRVGQLYGLNTLGCVMGAIIGGYLLLNIFNLDQLFKFVVFLGAVSAMLGLYLFRLYHPQERFRFAGTGVLVVMLVGIILFAPLYDRKRFVQPFRQQQPIPGVTYEGAKVFGQYLGKTTDFLVFRDGPNTSVGIGVTAYEGKEVSRSIFVNGKSDGNTRGDFFTTIMLAHIPGLLMPKLDNVAVIGFGTGTTIGTLSLYPEVERIDVADISGTILENRHEFDRYNHAVSKNPKVHVHEMDAFRYIEGVNQQFDLILSEPSNPWVAGIENLYSREFYQMVHRKMSSDGCLMQWIHTYSFTEDLLRMVLRTVSDEFKYVSVWQLKGGDLGILAGNRAFDRSDIRRAQRRWSSHPEAVGNLKEGGVTRLETVMAMEIIPPSLTPDIAVGADVHTLENPKLSNEAARAFFVNQGAKVDGLRRKYKAYYTSVMDSLLVDMLNGKMAPKELLDEFKNTFCIQNVSKTTFMCEEVLAALKVTNPSNNVVFDDAGPNPRELASLALFPQPFPKKFTATDIQQAYDMLETYRKYYSPIALISENAIFGRLDRCVETTKKTDEMYGECLLQKILGLETLQRRGPVFKDSVALFMDWFQKLPKTSPSYSKLSEARDILVRLLSESDS